MFVNVKQKWSCLPSILFDLNNDFQIPNLIFNLPASHDKSSKLRGEKYCWLWTNSTLLRHAIAQLRSKLSFYNRRGQTPPPPRTIVKYQNILLQELSNESVWIWILKPIPPNNNCNFDTYTSGFFCMWNIDHNNS